jgi:hypothetical protein
MKLLHAHRGKVLKFKNGGSVEVKGHDMPSINTSPLSGGVVGLSGKQMVSDPANQFRPVGISGPINITGNSASLGSGLKNISFAESKKVKKAKLKL